MERELNERLSHAPLPESDGSSAARACRTRASASVVCNVASSTTGVLPAAMFTASANERRSGTLAPGACAKRGAEQSAQSRASRRLLLLPHSKETEIDQNVGVRSDVD